MTFNSLVMQYLDSLAPSSQDKKFNIFHEKEHGEDLLSKKIAVLKRIQEISTQEDTTEAVSFFLPFLDHGWDLSRIYSAMLYEQKKILLERQSSSYDKQIHAQKIADMMILTALLQVVIFKDKHIHYKALKTLDQLLYDVADFDSKLEFKEVIAAPSELAGKIRENTRYYNLLLRLSSLRLYRVLNQLTKVLQDCKDYLNGLQAFKDNGGGVFFSYFSWVYFVPRILLNIYTLLSSIFDVSGLTGLEKAYGSWTRFKLQFQDLWQQLDNDLMWCTSGLMNCFILVGVIPMLGVYIMIAAQTHDFIVNCIINYIETRRLNNMMARFGRVGDLQDNPGLLDGLNKRAAFDKQFLFYTVANFAILLVCVAFMMPTFGSISPFIPLIAGIIAFLTTFFHFYNGEYFKKERKKIFGGSLIPDNAVGVLKIDYILKNENEVSDLPLGKYSSGLVMAEVDKVGFYLYKVDKGKKSFEHLQSAEAVSKFYSLTKDMSLSDTRAKSLSSDLFEEIIAENPSSSGMMVQR